MPPPQWVVQALPERTRSRSLGTLRASAATCTLEGLIRWGWYRTWLSCWDWSRRWRKLLIIVMCRNLEYCDAQDTRDANLSRFQGSASISSDMYFNRCGLVLLMNLFLNWTELNYEELYRDTPSSGGMPRSASSYSVQTPDMEDVKESVRQVIKKTSFRLPSLSLLPVGSE